MAKLKGRLERDLWIRREVDVELEGREASMKPNCEAETDPSVAANIGNL